MALLFPEKLLHFVRERTHTHTHMAPKLVLTHAKCRGDACARHAGSAALAKANIVRTLSLRGGVGASVVRAAGRRGGDSPYVFEFVGGSESAERGGRGGEPHLIIGDPNCPYTQKALRAVPGAVFVDRGGARKHRELYSEARAKLEYHTVPMVFRLTK